MPVLRAKECIDSGGEGERERERDKKAFNTQPQSSQEWVRSTCLCAALIGAIEVNAVFDRVAWIRFCKLLVQIDFPFNAKRTIIFSIPLQFPIAPNWSLQIHFWQQTFGRQMQVIVLVDISSLSVWSAI